MNYPPEIARWEDDGGAPVGRFELMAFVARGKAKSLPKPAKPTPARAA
jgi:hypothetical protein